MKPGIRKGFTYETVPFGVSMPGLSHQPVQAAVDGIIGLTNREMQPKKAPDGTNC